ncbi:MAG: hypothetical protein KDD35_08710, partial [Bdellovibrionales bacterium]|nr:hypothetical protein [Bdellovibrionales bacterium]
MLNTARGFAHFLLGAITALCPILVQATVTVQSISGVSNWVKEGSSIIVYGGFAGGEGAECIANGDGTCNNCVLGAGLAACNEKRSMLGSEITITVSSDSDESGPIILTTSDSSTKIGNNGDTISKGQTGSLKVTWSTLCATAFPNAGNSCVTTEYPSSSAASLIIGVDGNTDSKLSSGEGDTIIFRVHMPYNADTIALCSDTGATFTDGVCGFTVYPGDRKVFIEDLEPTSTFPSAGSIQFSAARFFFSTTGFTYGAEGPNPGSNFGYHDIPIVTEDDNYFLSNKSIDDLENNSYYFFRISMLDQANNVSFITSDAAISLACGGGNPADLKADEASDLACPFIARPDEVVGLLTKD